MISIRRQFVGQTVVYNHVGRHRLMADDTLNVRFGTLSHGWLRITFSLSGADILVDASDVPVDPIGQLVSLSRFLLSSALGSRDAEFSLEPEYAILTATKSDDPSAADFRLVQYGQKQSQAGLSRLTTATQIWRAVRGIEPKTLAAINDEQWSWDFPTTQMEMLASEIEAAKASQ